MSKRNLSLVILVVLLILGGCYFGSPYWALRQMQTAAKAGEGDRLSRYVDFPALRESFRSQLQTMLAGRLQRDTIKDNPFAALGMALATGVMNTMVDNMITPESLANMISVGKAKPTRSNTTPSSDAYTAANAEQEKEAIPRINRHYEGLGVFKVEMHEPQSNKLMIVLVLNREGWFGWKLTSVRVPALTEAVAQTAPKSGPESLGSKRAGPSASVGVSRVMLGKAIGPNKKVTAVTETFDKFDTIFAVVETTGTGYSTLTAKWSFHRGDRSADVSESTEAISATGPSVTVFKVYKPSGWPSGNYRVEFVLGGVPVSTKQFIVK